jgi:hypothetical protein
MASHRTYLYYWQLVNKEQQLVGIKQRLIYWYVYQGDVQITIMNEDMNLLNTKGKCEWISAWPMYDEYSNNQLHQKIWIQSFE